MSIIWGHPGTGKSAVAVVIINTLLFNDQYWRGIAKFASRKEISGPATHLSDMFRKNLQYWTKRREPIPDSRSPMLVISETVTIFFKNFRVEIIFIFFYFFFRTVLLTS